MEALVDHVVGHLVHVFVEFTGLLNDVSCCLSMYLPIGLIFGLEMLLTTEKFLVKLIACVASSVATINV